MVCEKGKLDYKAKLTETESTYTEKINRYFFSYNIILLYEVQHTEEYQMKKARVFFGEGTHFLL